MELIDETLNDKQAKVLEFIKDNLANVGYPPSVREICKAVGFKSTSTAHKYLNDLAAKGVIRKDGTKTRAIEILNSPSINDVTFIPLVGKVTAGPPILAVENKEQLIPVSSEFASKSKELFMLRIQGESMIEAGILDGDMIIVEKNKSVKNGDIVVALIENEATVKYFHKEKSKVRLIPANSTMKPIEVNDLESFEVLGKVIGLHRKY